MSIRQTTTALALTILILLNVLEHVYSQDILPIISTAQPGSSTDQISLSPDGMNLYILSRSSNSLLILDTRTFGIVAESHPDYMMQSVNSSSDGSHLYIVGGDRDAPDTLHITGSHGGRPIKSIATNLRITGIADDENLDRIFVTGQEFPLSSIGAPYLVVLSASTYAVLEKRFIGVNDSAYAGSPLADSCRHILYVFMSIRALGTSLQAYDGATLERLPERGAQLTGLMSPRQIVGRALDNVRDRVITTSSNDETRTDLQAIVRDVRASDSVPLPRVGPVAIDKRTGIVYIVGQPNRRRDAATESDIGTLMAVDLDARQVIASRDLGHGPHTIAIDQQTSRVFVTNVADQTITVVDGIQPPPGTPGPDCPATEPKSNP